MRDTPKASVAMRMALSATVMSLMGLPLAGSPAAAAVIIDVTTTADLVSASDGVVSLREAISQANGAGDAVEIYLATNATYVLDLCIGTADEDANAGGDLDLVSAHPVAIHGNGATVTNTCAEQRHLQIANEASLDHVTLVGGRGPDGIAILSSGPLSLDHVEVADSTRGASPSGLLVDGVEPAAVLHLGPSASNLTVDHVVVTDTVGGTGIGDHAPTPSPGAITFSVDHSTISRNAGGSVGGLHSARSGLQVMNSDVSGNTASCGLCSIASAAGIASGVDFPVLEYTYRPLVLTNVQVVGNTGGLTGGAFGLGLTIMSSVIADNSGTFVGGVTGAPTADSAAVNIAQSAIRGNTGGSVGGVFGSGTITNSTVADNTGGFIGGFAVLGVTEVRNSTLTGNVGAAVGGIGPHPVGGDVQLTDSTVADNSVDAGTLPPCPPFACNYGAATEIGSSALSPFWANGELSVTATGTVIGPGSGGYDACSFQAAGSTPPASLGWNFTGDDSCFPPGVTGDRLGGGDPALLALGNYGGPTPTRPPSAASVLHDAIPFTVPRFSAYDQRGVTRITGLGSDIGATEADDAGPEPGRGYHPVEPVRIYDSRAPGNLPLGPGQERSIPVAGLGGVPLAGATAVAMNVTVADTDHASHLTVWPPGSPAPSASSLNWSAGDTVANLVTSVLAPDGSVRVRNNQGSAQVIIDVAGWYDNGVGVTAPPEICPCGDALTAMAPVRVLDTRAGIGGTATRFGAGEARDITVAGANGVPVDVDAVVINLTGVLPSSFTHLSAWPTGSSVPGVSNLNLSPGLVAANLAIVKVGDGGRISIRNQAGTLDVVADVFGYFAPGAGPRFHPLTALRVLDTREDIGTTQGALGPAEVRSLIISPPAATAILMNVTATNGDAGTHVSVAPATPVPEVSNLNVDAGRTRPNAVLTGVGPSDSIVYRNNSGSIDVIADAAGWFGP